MVARLIVLSVSLVVLAGCPGSLEDPDRFLAASARDGGTVDAGAPICPPGFDVPQDVFVASCDGVGCHGAEGAVLGLDLVSDGVRARLLGRDMVNAACAPAPTLDPADPRGSGLYLKVSGTLCGAQMPLAGALTSGEVDCLERWIAGDGS